MEQFPRCLRIKVERGKENGWKAIVWDEGLNMQNGCLSNLGVALYVGKWNMQNVTW